MSKKWPMLDLHGKTVSEVFDLIDQFIVKHSNSPKVLIMTGKGSGAVQKEAKKYLNLGGFDWIYHQDWAGKKNSGILEVQLK